MCYSAMIEADYSRYLRETGAQMELAQFVEIFGQRAQGAKIAIPRAVERWFDEPTTPAERQVRQLISLHRAATRAALEQEIAGQKERLAGALQKLATKPTKAAAESQRIASDKIEKAERRLAGMLLDRA